MDSSRRAEPTVVVARFQGAHTAHLAKGCLEADGIEAFVSDEHTAEIHADRKKRIPWFSSNPWRIPYMKRIAPALMMTLSTLLPSPISADEKPAPHMEMTTYYVGLLYRGPNSTSEVTPETRKIQEAHMAHIREMAQSGKLILAGPFSDDGKLRGMFIFRVDTMEEAKALAEEDPAVKAGRLIVELHPWYSAKGIRVDPSPQVPSQPPK